MKMDLGFGWVSETISCTNLCAVPEITNTSPQMGMEFSVGWGLRPREISRGLGRSQETYLP